MKCNCPGNATCDEMETTLDELVNHNLKGEMQPAFKEVWPSSSLVKETVRSVYVQHHVEGRYDIFYESRDMDAFVAICALGGLLLAVLTLRAVYLRLLR